MALTEEDKKRIEEEEAYRKEIREEKTVNQKKKKWYHSSGGIILLLVLFFPVGLYLMWKHATWSKNVKWIITGLFGLYVLFSAFTVNYASTTNVQSNPQSNPQSVSQPTQAPTKKPEPTKDTSQHELDATIKFNDVAFQITNNESDDWTNCRFEMNSGLFSGGYTYKQSLFAANDVIIVPFREFTKGDGTRFNAYETKPQNVSLSCEVKGKHGFNYFGIE